MCRIIRVTSVRFRRSLKRLLLFTMLMPCASLPAWSVEGQWTQLAWNPAGAPAQISISGHQRWAIDIADRIYEFNGTLWVQRPGDARRVSVSSDGDVWVLNSVGAIYRWASSHWLPIEGRAKDISAATGRRTLRHRREWQTYALGVQRTAVGGNAWGVGQDCRGTGRGGMGL